MKKIFLVLIIFSTSLQAQQLGINGGYGVGILENSTFEFATPAGYTFDATYTSAIKKLNLNYNLGVEYSTAGWGNQILFKTGISKVLLRPSGFIRAADKESVTLVKNNWLVSVDLNIYNGIMLSDSTQLYMLAAEPAIVGSYKIGKTFFISGSIAPRFSWCPGQKDYAYVTSHTDIIFKLGVTVFFLKNRFKP